MSTLINWQNSILALMAWREARGESYEAKRAVINTARNRVAHPKGPYARCPDLWSTILCPWQFSSFHPKDNNAVLMPHPGDDSFVDCCKAVDDPAPDNTGGATHYHSYPVGSKDWPAWAIATRLTVTIGAFNFYHNVP